MSRDPEKMGEGQLLRELVRRFMSYDKAKDNYVDFLQRQLEKAGVDYEAMPRWERLHMKQDEGFCRCREICRIVRKDKNLMWC